MTEFSPASDSYWKVFLNTGGSFSATPQNWSLPAGGDVNNGVNRGYWTLSAVGDDTGSDSWSTFDINGDDLPDLVCTGWRNSNGYVTEFSPASNSYWKVFLNTGSGFSATSVNWMLPSGGETNTGVNTGFWALEGIGEDKTQGPLFLALALVFDPYDQAVKWRDRPLGVRVWLAVHMIVTLASFGWMFFNE